MHEIDLSNPSSVPHRELFEFANTLFSYLYYHLDMQSSFDKTSIYFQEIIGKAVLSVEKNTSRFNNDVIDQAMNTSKKLSLCQEVCRSYPSEDYFRKLYYMTAFILDLVIWKYRRLPTVDFSMGPDLWMRVFRTNFDGTFQNNGAWQGFLEAAEDMLEKYDPQNEHLAYCMESFIAGSFTAYMAYLGNMRTRENSELYNTALQAFESLEMKDDEEGIEELTEAEESEEGTENNQSADTEEKQSISVTSEEKVQIQEPLPSTSGESMRKRRHDSRKKHSDTELDSEDELDKPTQVGKKSKSVPISQEESEIQMQEPSGGSLQNLKGKQKRKQDSPISLETEPDSKEKTEVGESSQIDKLRPVPVSPGKSKVRIQQPSESASENLEEKIEDSNDMV